LKHPRRKQDICRHTAVYPEKDRDHFWDLAIDDGITFKSFFGDFFFFDDVNLIGVKMNPIVRDMIMIGAQQ